jgi:ubiquinone/menaquinone biosynthesis C-methylase UbiE
MTDNETDKVFSGPIAEMYDTYLVPLLFEPYAADLAARLTQRPLANVLEIAAGTGVVTRRLASALPPTVSIVATDLNQAMIDHAAARGTTRPVTWQLVDAMSLPFGDKTFDAVVCQFGAMFFPEKGRAFAEARRVLRDGGVFIFSVWDRIEENEFAHTVENALVTLFPDDPPRFLSRTPHGYYDQNTIRQDLARGGFSKKAEIVSIAARSRAASAQIPAVAYCQGSPLRTEIENRGQFSLMEATDVAEAAIRRQFGNAEIDGKIQAHVVTVEA